jgi:FtsP/CotA-like multicopper oxidase with cupredoxin domain
MALAAVPLALACTNVLAQAVPGGTLDPTTIPKYVTPLVIPPVLFDDKGGQSPLDVQVSLRQFTQQILPPADTNGSPLPPTPLWGYGDPTEPETYFNPSFTIEVTKDTPSTVKWINELVADPARCNGNNPACDFLTHVITDQNGVPIIDQTLHWAAPNMDCLDGDPRPDCRGASADPYMGPVPMVVHVHGAHVGPGSDGYPEAWWLPAAGNIDCAGVGPDRPNVPNYACNGTFFESAEGADTANALGEGYAIDLYSNDQPTTTLWYHDHSLGITRLNVYAGGAGFWLIRGADNGESGLITGTLPGPAPQKGDDPNCFAVDNPGMGMGGGKGPGPKCVRGQIREIPLAIQPKSFNADGTQFYPADRIFFQQDERPTDEFPDNDGQTFSENLGLNIPFLPQQASDIAPVWNPEAFFNTMVVNGKTWPQLEVASERYRLRVLNAADSRFLNLALFEVTGNGLDGIPGTADDVLGDEIPFYQIGAEQGLLPEVVRIQTGEAVTLPGDGSEPDPAPDPNDPTALLVGPAERADVIVDFTGLADGTVVRMTNTAPDAPFGGFPDDPADPGTTGQVMQFVIDTTLNAVGGDPSTAPKDLELDDNPGGVPLLDPTAIKQDLALLEEESAEICVDIDTAAGTIKWVPDATPDNGCVLNGEEYEAFAPKAAVLGVDGSGGGVVQLWDDPIAQNPALDSVEEWELWNWSADAHPIHLHLVKFQVVNRQAFDIDTGNPGAVRDPEPWEAGWKDTVIAYPEEVTRVRALFDIAGLYVWHCHILSHEDNEMMVPYCVGTPGEDCPAELF